MTTRTMDAHCEHLEELKAQRKALDAEIAKEEAVIKAECNGMTMVWKKFKAVFAMTKTVKLGYTAKEIRDKFPDIFEKLGGFEEEKAQYKGIYRI